MQDRMVEAYETTKLNHQINGNIKKAITDLNSNLFLLFNVQEIGLYVPPEEFNFWQI